MMRNLVLGIEAVLADGTVLTSLNRMIKNNAGYDLKHLFIGSEGTLGIVTRVVLRLRQKPRSHNAALVAVTDFDKLTALLAVVDGGLAGTLSAFEVMWEPFYRLVTSEPARNRPPLAYGHPYYVLIEALGSSQERDSERFEAVLDEAMTAGFITDAVLAKSRAERDKLWAMRDDVEQLGRLAPIFTYDVSLPIPTMPGYVDEVRAGLERKWKDPACVVFGHLGDGNLHVVVGVGNGDLPTRRQVEEIVYGPLRARGGSVSAEHGIGTEKRKYLSWSRTEAEIAVMRALKQTLDPRGILNPGKVIEMAQEQAPAQQRA
jgi:FAD/FMN-containing dehydrogenase